MMHDPSQGGNMHLPSPPPHHSDTGKDGSKPSSGKDEEQDKEEQGSKGELE